MKLKFKKIGRITVPDVKLGWVIGLGLIIPVFLFDIFMLIYCNWPHRKH